MFGSIVSGLEVKGGKTTTPSFFPNNWVTLLWQPCPFRFCLVPEIFFGFIGWTDLRTNREVDFSELSLSKKKKSFWKVTRNKNPSARQRDSVEGRGFVSWWSEIALHFKVSTGRFEKIEECCYRGVMQHTKLVTNSILASVTFFSTLLQV